MRTKRIALLASGSGSNVENIVRYFTGKEGWEFPLILSNKADAYVHQRAKNLKIPSFTIPKAGFENGDALQLLQQYNVDFIVVLLQ